MTKIIRETVFFLVASVIILPAPTWVLAWMTGMTLTEVLYR
jgi:hypothetical protein